MITLVTEQSIGRRIKALVKGRKDVSIAVAFWGAGAIEHLGLSEAVKGRVIVNLESGSSNPNEIKKLIALNKRKERIFQVRALRDLHAKVYATRDRFVLGSSNASANGLAVRDAAVRWHEANLESSHNDATKEVAEWFGKRWKEAKPVTEQMLTNADKLWALRTSQAQMQRVAGLGLIAACKQDPSILDGHSVVLYLWNKPNQQKAYDAVEERCPGSTLPEDFWVYESSEFSPKTWLIDCNVGRRKPKYGGVTYTGDTDVWKVPFEGEWGESFASIAYEKPAVVLNGLELSIKTEEKRAIERAAPALWNLKHHRVRGRSWERQINLKDVLDHIDLSQRGS